MKYFVLDSLHDYDKVIAKFLSGIEEHCRSSGFQYLTREKIVIDIDESEDFEYRDFYYVNSHIPLCSVYMNDCMSEPDLSDSLYEIEAEIRYKGREERYYISVPRRIDCLDPGGEDHKGYENARHIIDDMTGRFYIFKLKGDDDRIYIKEPLAGILNYADISGADIKII